MATVFMAGLQFLPFNMSPENETGLSVRDDGAFFTALFTSSLSLGSRTRHCFLVLLEESIKDTHTCTRTRTHTRTGMRVRLEWARFLKLAVALIPEVNHVAMT